MSNEFKVHILGSSAAIPTSVRLTTTQVVNYHNKQIMLDCAEATQIQLRKLRLPLMRFNHIFISHLHGDHYLGLPGLIFTLHLLGRKNKLHVYAPEGLQEMIELQYRISNLEPGYEIVYHLIHRGEQLIFQDKHITVHTIEMMHRLPSFGFLIREKPVLPNIKKEAIEKYNISIRDIQRIKSGKDLTLENGEIISNEDLTIPPPPPRSYAFCSDTGYTHQYLDQIRGVDLLYHEATFLHDKEEIAREKTHCTALQAAMIAREAQVKKLLIGHFSARYEDLSPFIDEAVSVFPDTMLAEEGKIIEIPFNKG